MEVHWTCISPTSAQCFEPVPLLLVFAGQTATVTFAYTGSVATWTVPSGVSTVTSCVVTGGGGGGGGADGTSEWLVVQAIQAAWCRAGPAGSTGVCIAAA